MQTHADVVPTPESVAALERLGDEIAVLSAHLSACIIASPACAPSSRCSRPRSTFPPRPDHRASWKMTPSVYREPLSKRLTPWRIAAR